MRPLSLACIIALGMALTACGGEGGGSVASSPPPATVVTPAQARQVVQTGMTEAIGAPLAPTPALTSGTYPVLGIISTQRDCCISAIGNLRASDLRISIDAASKTYTLGFDPAVFPGLTAAGVPPGQLAYTIDDPRYGHEYRLTFKYSDGTTQIDDRKGEAAGAGEKGGGGFTSYTTITGKRYVSMGNWSMPGQFIAFVYGERTLPAALPVSGTATYRANTIEDGNGADITLTANFAARSLTASLLAVYDDALGYHAPVIRMAGSGTIDRQGAFEFPLSGDYADTPARVPLTPITGTLGGGFYGPDASQIGGYWTTSQGNLDLFVAEKQ